MDFPTDLDFLAEDDVVVQQNPWEKVDIASGGEQRITEDDDEEPEQVILHNQVQSSWAYRGGQMNRGCIKTVLSILDYLKSSKFCFKRAEMSTEDQTQIIQQFRLRGVKKIDPQNDRQKFHKNLRSWITSLYMNFTKESDFEDDEYKSIVKNERARLLALQGWKSDSKSETAKRDDPRTKSLKQFTEVQRLQVSAHSAELKFRAEALLPQPITSSASIPREAKRKRGVVDVNMRKKRKVKKLTHYERLQKEAANISVATVKRKVLKDALAGPPEPKLHKFLTWLSTHHKFQSRLFYDVEFVGIKSALETKYMKLLKNGDKLGIDLLMARLTFMATNPRKDEMFKEIHAFLINEEEEEEEETVSVEN